MGIFVLAFSVVGAAGVSAWAWWQVTRRSDKYTPNQLTRLRIVAVADAAFALVFLGAVIWQVIASA